MGKIKIIVIAACFFFTVLMHSLLIPFYPQFFDLVFGISDPMIAGGYLSSLCLCTIVCLPIWSKLSKRMGEVNVWLISRSIACLLSFVCYFISSIEWFWLISLVMFGCRSTFLLSCPFILKASTNINKSSIVGLFVVLMYLGGICGAVMGGAILDYGSASTIFLWISLSELLIICGYVLVKLKSHALVDSVLQTELRTQYPLTLFKLCLISAVVCFSNFIIQPFFTLYIHDVSENLTDLHAGLIFAIPAIAALLIYSIQIFRVGNFSNKSLIFLGFFFAVIGMLLQTQSQLVCIIVGRCIYAWAIYQLFTRLEGFLFDQTSPEHFSQQYTIMVVGDRIGEVIASFCSALMVEYYGLVYPFYMSTIGFLVAGLLFYLLFHRNPINHQPLKALP
ncbi:MAG: MFS transporter [Cellvibrionales bacterium]|nr:MFS transporter [Cellvibrionales bacterium]